MGFHLDVVRDEARSLIRCDLASNCNRAFMIEVIRVQQRENRLVGYFEKSPRQWPLASRVGCGKLKTL
jgi:hypothetical protein